MEVELAPPSRRTRESAREAVGQGPGDPPSRFGVWGLGLGFRV